MSTNQKPKERPIIFNTEMVKAILGGRKTMTRRVVSVDRVDGHPQLNNLKIMTLKNGKQGWLNSQDDHENHINKFSPFGLVGDRLYVRETWQLHSRATDLATVVYAASEQNSWSEMHRLIPADLTLSITPKPFQEGWRSSIHMPRIASRITLEITDIRIERLNDISEEDAKAEGVQPIDFGYGDCYALGFNKLWDEIYGDESWSANPWVWVVEFKRVIV